MEAEPQNTMSRNFKVKRSRNSEIRGTAMHIAEKYGSLARDAMWWYAGEYSGSWRLSSSTQSIMTEIVLAAQAQNMPMPGMEGQPGMNGGGRFNQPEPFQRDFDGDSDEGDIGV